MPWSKAGNSLSNGKKLLSASYREYLGRPVDKKTQEEFKAPDGTTWSDLIAYQVVRRAVGIVGKDSVCFTAITELRETTEGKTAERIVAAGNEELEALARAITGEPAPVPHVNPAAEGE